MSRLLALVGGAVLASVAQSSLPDSPVLAGDRDFEFQRTVTVPSEGGSQACVVLDAAMFAHGSPALADVRLRAPGSLVDLPYVLTVSEAGTAANDAALVQNLGRVGNRIVFDLAMPARAYTDVDLDLRGKNFLAIATVSGQTAGGEMTALGEYTLYDLSARHLDRNAVLALPESTFSRLHVSLRFSPVAGGTAGAVPEMVAGASVPPSREAQRLFTTVAETGTIREQGRKSLAEFMLPARVPVERVSFQVAREAAANFSREVVITGHLPPNAGDPSEAERLTGEITQVNFRQAGQTIRREELTVPAVLGVNMQATAAVDVAVENGDDRPLALAAVRLEMRQRQLCFTVLKSSLRLLYGASSRTAPVYDLGRTFRLGAPTRVARLGPEERNPLYVARDDTRSLTDRHPELVWIVLLAVMGVLAIVAFRSARHLSR